jgi:hypothetical protein
MKRKLIILICLSLNIGFAFAQTYLMRTSGYVSDTICSGNFYDNGGPNGDYISFQDDTVTIYPSTPGSKVSVNFSSFSTFNSYDFLAVYNGNSASAPLMANLFGTVAPGSIISTAADGSLTFRFYSHSGNTAAGWAATIACVAPFSIPASGNITMLSSGTYQTCSANFYDIGGASGNYILNQDATVTFYPTDTVNQKLSINFSSFATNSSTDYLDVFNGNSTAATKIAHLFGTVSPGSIISTASNGSLTLRFFSYYASVGVAAGWAAIISCTGVPTANISISSSQIPPWQREGDDFSGSITVDLSNAGTNPTWHLEADYFGANNNYLGAIIYPSLTAATTTQNFSTATDPQLKAQTIQGYHFTWNAVLESNNSAVIASQQTNIIEKKWDKKNIAIYNENGEQLGIPLKYLPNATQVQVIFCRDGADITSSENEVSLTLPLDDIRRLTNINNCSIPPQVYCLLNNPNNDFCQEIDNSGYFKINVGNDNNLKTVPPGELKYSIFYLDNSNQVISSASEMGLFELVKVGKVNYSGNAKAVVFVADWNSNIYSDINAVTNGDDNSKQSWSITKSYRWTDKGYDTYYISQNNIGYTQRNAYDIGIALDKLLEKNPNINEVNLVCHGKAGLEVRALLSNYAVSYSNFPNSFFDFAPATTLFTNFQCSNKLKKIAFLASPNNGLGFINNTIGIVGMYDGTVFPGFKFSPAYKEMLRYFGYNFIGILNQYGKIPFGIQIANLTSYRSYISINPSFNYHNYVSEFTDGLVPSWSSEDLYLTYPDNSPVFIKQMFQESHNFICHNDVNTNYGLFLVSSPIHASMNCIPLNSSNLEKLVTFITGDPVTYNYTIPFTTCLDPSMGQLSSQAFGSILSGAFISRKIYGDTLFYPLGKTGENGEFNATIIPALQIGDSLKFEAPGYETLVLVIDSTILSVGKVEASLIKSLNQSNKIKYPSLILTNQSPITLNNTISLEATGQNVLAYQINSPFSQDSVFVPLALSNNRFTTQLDTGYNHILIKFVGLQDTVTLGKEIFYFPDSLMSQNTYNVTLLADSMSLGTKVYVNNEFFKQINTTNDIIPVLLGQNEIKFTKFGYTDSLITVASATTINLSLQLVPYSYSSPTDSSIIDFTTQGKLQYRRNVTMLDSAQASIITLKQYDDSFPGKGLIPESRKFEFRRMNAPAWSNIQTAMALDQIKNLSVDSIYLMKISNDTSFTKIFFDSTGTVAGYDSVVQKLNYNYINFDNGTTNKEALIIMKRKFPIVKSVSPLSVNENDSLTIPLSQFFADSDSIHNDMTFQVPNPTPTGINLSINNGILSIKANHCFSGNTSFNLRASHDGLSTDNTVSITIVADPPTPTITKNGNQLASNASSGNQWYLNGTSIAGATGQTYTPTASGNYTVQVTKNGCASAFSNSISFIVTSVPNISVYGNQIKVFPNPVKDKLTIVNSTNSPFPLNITLIEISGEQLKVISSSDPVIEIDMNRYSNGIYILRIESKENKIKGYKMIEKIQ